jgi:ABC-type multidrug transport system fused ATPase/permease subunit
MFVAPAPAARSRPQCDGDAAESDGETAERGESTQACAPAGQHVSAGSKEDAAGGSPRPDGALLRRRFNFIFFAASQAWLMVSLLAMAALTLAVQFFFDANRESELIRLFVAWVGVSLATVIVTVVPPLYFLATERARPTWWMWADFALAALSCVLSALVISISAGALDADWWGLLAALTLVVNALRMYVRSAVFADVGHAKWHELHVGKASPRVSSFLITYCACEVLVREAPLAQLGFFLCAVVAAAMGPLISLTVSTAISTAPAELQVGAVVGQLAGVIAAGMAAGGAMATLSAWSFSIGSAALQRRLALKAVYGSDPNTGLLTSTFSQGLAKVQSLWLAVYFTLIFNLLQLVLNLSFLFSVDAVLALILLALLQVIQSVQWLKNATGEASVGYGAQLGKQQAAMENLIALRTAARTNRAGWWLMLRWDQLGERVRNALFKSQLTSNFYNLSFQVMSWSVYLVAVSSVFTVYAAGRLTQQQAFAATGYIIGTILPMVALGGYSSRTVWTAGPVMTLYAMSSEDIAEDAKPEPDANPEPGPHAPRASGLVRNVMTLFSGLRGSLRGGGQREAYAGGGSVSRAASEPLRGPHVVVSGLVFQYPSAAAPTLTGLSAEVRPGEYVALCGGSGSGKTTLLRLMGRADCSHCDANAGSITVDGLPANDYTRTAFCTQSFDVLNGTVRDNISFGCAWGSIDDVRAAAALADIAPVIEQMPEGFDTVIGRGSTVTLSGGQLARLGLARALCRRPRLLLLDEVTSPLDPEVRLRATRGARAGVAALPASPFACSDCTLTRSDLLASLTTDHRRSAWSLPRSSSSGARRRSPSCSARTPSRPRRRRSE